MATQTGTKRHLGITSDTVVTNSDITVGGNLTVEGTTTTLDTANLLVEDKNIIIGNVSTPTDTTADGGGITLKVLVITLLTGVTLITGGILIKVYIQPEM